MASIGAFTVQIWNGTMREAMRQVRLHAREGVDGVGMIRGSYRNRPSTVTTEASVASKDAALALRADYRLLHATLVDCVDGDGTRFRNVAVMAVESNHFLSPVIDGGADASHTYMVVARWLLLPPYQARRQGI